MELGSILQFLENRAILVTGATGFLAKIFIEKILRVQPNVKKLYLLLRASDTKSAMLRFNNEIIAKELFKVLKEKCGENLNYLISEKVKVVAGDISCENLGVKDSSLLDEMLTQVDVVLNLAATTNFDDRYDVSLGLNTVGASHVLNFSKKCNKLKVLVHVSTAFVSGEREGLIMETPYKMGETLNGATGLDIDAEKRLVEETLKQLKAQNVPEDSITSSMKDLGIQRARKFGWPNTYVFTKAMGEMLMGEYKDNTPLVIIRPTIVTSTYKEPFVGWVGRSQVNTQNNKFYTKSNVFNDKKDGTDLTSRYFDHLMYCKIIRTIDSLAVGYGKGRLTCFLGDPKNIIDVIPADMVVNAIILAMVAHANQANESIVYHVGSSVSHPVEFTYLQDYGFRYFTQHPWINKDGKPVIVGKVKVLSTMESFQRYMMIRYFLPLKGLRILNMVFCKYFQSSYIQQSRKIKFVMRLIDLYAPYLFFKAFYDDMNTEKLRRATKESGVETEMFYFDPKCINWEDYFMNTHIPGIVKRVFKNN